MKEYTFDVSIKLTVMDIQANNEAEARQKLTGQVTEYFGDPCSLAISKGEAKLVSVA